MTKTILIVDDDAGWQTLLGIMLKREGFETLKAKDAKAALETLDKSTPDLMITDYTMPGMNGIDLCAVVRQGRGLTFPIILLSGRYDDDYVDRAKAAGVNEILQVPIAAKDLVPRIHALINAAQGGEAKTDGESGQTDDFGG